MLKSIEAVKSSPEFKRLTKKQQKAALAKYPKGEYGIQAAVGRLQIPKALEDVKTTTQAAANKIEVAAEGVTQAVKAGSEVNAEMLVEMQRVLVLFAEKFVDKYNDTEKTIRLAIENSKPDEIEAKKANKALNDLSGMILALKESIEPVDFGETHQALTSIKIQVDRIAETVSKKPRELDVVVTKRDKNENIQNVRLQLR